MRLLIVDDHEVVRRGVRSLLLEQSESTFAAKRLTVRMLSTKLVS